jgi:thiol-disulfide isomerase/thioredoxin
MPAASPGASESPASQPLAFSGAILAGTSAPLLDFRKEDYDAAIQTSKLIVLYFFATWCPSCQAEFPRMQSAFDKLTTNEVIGFRVNYNDGDTDAAERALAKEYGVAYQHTKVLVRNGERLLKAPDVWSEERYALEIKKHLAS